ncbi:hypothetical protein AB0B45_34905 [Nonomuraea sp. NPDC049152]|uniref:hypothetical protein n=1 Tax=Nonomuraea sp. NPDC049152 TaxID=3154350 RepID=UPI0033DF92B4
MDFILAAVLLLLALLMLAWPVLAVAAFVLVALALLTCLRSGRMAVRGRTLTRAGWLLTAAAVCTATAAYGYGLVATTFGAWTDPDDRCALAQPETYGYGYRGPDGGTQSMWPLHDTTCGPELVPGFVNPLVAGSAGLFVVLAVIMTVVKVRSRRRPRQG